MSRKRSDGTKFDNMLLTFLLAFSSAIVVATESKFNFTWWKDVNVWINDFFVNMIIFCITYMCLQKIKSQSLSLMLSYFLSLIIGNFIYLDITDAKLTWQLVIAIVGAIVAVIYSTVLGSRKAREKEWQRGYDRFCKLASMSNKERTELYNVKRFIQKHPKECELISQIGIEGILKLIEDEKAVRKAIKK
jgi:hypothetical protein